MYEEAPTHLLTHLDTATPKKNGVIYIHVPYCSKICTFCSLRRTLNQPAPDYADLIVEELKAYAALAYIKASTFDSVYFGGGTPTTLETDALVRILETIRDHYALTPTAEISLETTLTELDPSKAAAIRSAGANRLSVGVQTFQDRGRRLFNRRGNRAFAIERLQAYREVGFENVNIDVIYNYEAQTLEEISDDVRLADALGMAGFSMYSLMTMNGSALKTGDADWEFKLFHTLAEDALSRGFRFFETTKMVKTDPYKYIARRLQGADTLPIGAGAGGSLAGIAMMNPIQMDAYRAQIHAMDRRTGHLKKQKFENLDLCKGYFQQCFIPKSILSAYPQILPTVDAFLKDDMIYEEETRYRFTVEGVYWGNNLTSQLLSVLYTQY